MRVLTFGREMTAIHQLLSQHGLTLVTEEPDVIITHGGDGTLLEAERLYPGKSKLAIRHESICKNCVDHEVSHLIKLLAAGSLKESQIMKVEAQVGGRKLVGLNEICLYHQVPNQAVRFSVQINDEPVVNKAIGDGVMIATPFGSHAYYRSVTNSTFRSGLGIAYNNTTEAIDHTVVREDDTVTVALQRGPAYLFADNDPDMVIMEEGDSFTVRRSLGGAILLGLEHTSCPDCGEVAAVIAQQEEL